MEFRTGKIPSIELYPHRDEEIDVFFHDDKTGRSSGIRVRTFLTDRETKTMKISIFNNNSHICKYDDHILLIAKGDK